MNNSILQFPTRTRIYKPTLLGSPASTHMSTHLQGGTGGPLWAIHGHSGGRFGQCRPYLVQLTDQPFSKIHVLAGFCTPDDNPDAGVNRAVNESCAALSNTSSDLLLSRGTMRYLSILSASRDAYSGSWYSRCMRTCIHAGAHTSPCHLLFLHLDYVTCG